MSFFETINVLPVDPNFQSLDLFVADKNPKKVNLGVGAYRDALGQPLVFTAIRKAEKLLEEKHLPKEYLPILGSKDYIDETAKLIFGEGCPQLKDGLVFGAQSVGGTSALRTGGELIANEKNKIIYIPNLTWTNHKIIFNRAGLKTEIYPYYDNLHHSFDYKEMLEGIKKIPERATILLQGTSHNPTGLNPSMDQWKELSALIKQKKLLPFFDIAYQGFGTGLKEDMQPLQYFVSQGHDMLVAYTYAKNMGLYGERAGAFYAVSQKNEQNQKVKTHVSQIIRSTYSNPPIHPAQLVTTVLQADQLRKEWEQELKNVVERITDMRTAFITGLLSRESGSQYNFLTKQKQTGLFIYLGLNPDQVHRLKQEFSIYLPDGRVNVAGLNWSNMEYVIDAILSV